MPYRLSFLNRRMVFVIMAAILSASLLSSPALATQTTPATPEAEGTAAGPKFIIRPLDGRDGDYFTVEAEAGTVTELTVLLGSADDDELTLRTYATDAVPIANGGFSLAEEDVPVAGPATWLDYPAETFTFEAGEGVERTFTVTIPEETAPGQYIAGLALQTADSLEVEGTAMFRQVIRKSVAIFIVVPGPEEPAFELGEPELLSDAAVQRIAVPVVNQGNVLVKPEGELTLLSENGETVFTASVTMGSVYAGTIAPLVVALTTPLPTGTYTLSVALVDEVTGATAAALDVALGLAGEAEVADYSFETTVVMSPDPENPVFAEISTVITNERDAITNAEVLLDVSRDGELVETFVLASSLALPRGTTEVNQRYIPPQGFEPGTWDFVLRLNIVDPSTEAVTTVATDDQIPSVDVEG